MCLTGVDYFSTLGYQPGIAFPRRRHAFAGGHARLVLLTLFGALPMYCRVAELSPDGEGSVALLEELLPRWRGKTLVLCLLGFAFTAFVITITLSAADATAHIIENPFVPHCVRAAGAADAVPAGGAGAVFLKGFREAVGLAVRSWSSTWCSTWSCSRGRLHHIWQTHLLAHWQAPLSAEHGSPFSMVLVALVLFPKLALGLSGFETGVAVMPLVRGDADDIAGTCRLGRIRNTRRLLDGGAAS